MNHLFVTSCCPNCDRTSQFPIEVLGRRSACRHCAHPFTVRDSDSEPAGESDSMVWWLKFTEAGSKMSPQFELPEKSLPR
ncbi:DUF2614 family zinc ribbon-containing protein [Mariniblastus fucicola]|uniref:Uncharacterized protein n=1 Tax=Mariniblastus fucicola TaxID=980251 RepID=A0A5B9PBZ2_9BACT|nr:DUF2614 family zinc ribbon-containing protein [Mariniblastus fucicola]QEG23784.1 hypothetical protein MFFC18_36870 [Mariniblastus fucicola]